MTAIEPEADMNLLGVYPRSRRLIKFSSLLICGIFISACSNTEKENGLKVPNNQYILLERQGSTDSEKEYAAVKLTVQNFRLPEQKDNPEKLIKYTWVSLYSGQVIVNIDDQNFKMGHDTGQGRFGIGFDNYRFKWLPDKSSDQAVITTWLQSENKVKYCLSDYKEIWGLNIREEIIRLDKAKKCHK